MTSIILMNQKSSPETPLIWSWIVEKEGGNQCQVFQGAQSSLPVRRYVVHSLLAGSLGGEKSDPCPGQKGPPSLGLGDWGWDQVLYMHCLGGSQPSWRL